MARHHLPNTGLEDRLEPTPFAGRGSRSESMGALTQVGSKPVRRGNHAAGWTKAAQSTVYGEGRVVLSRPHPVQTRFKGKPGA